MAYITPLLSAIVDAVKKSASSVDRDFMEIEKLQNSVKSIKTFVFNSYTRLEQNLKIELSKIRADIPVLTPSDKIAGSSYFAVSPIEGLINFAHGNPDFAVSVALVENNDIVCAVIYSPVHDELFFAFSGMGAFKEGFRNQERLRTSSLKDLSSALIASTASFETDLMPLQQIHAAILKATGNLRISGCAALDLAYVAAGKYDAFVGSKCHFCAIAAGLLMVKEAGGAVRALSQKDGRAEDMAAVRQTGDLAATNFGCSQSILTIFK